MSSWQGKSKGTPLGYRIFVWILKNAGLSPAYFLLRFVVFYYFLFSWKASGHIYRLYRNKLGFGAGKSLRCLRNHCFNISIRRNVKIIVPFSSECFDQNRNSHVIDVE